MAFLTNQKWYCSSVDWAAVAAWAATTAYAAGQLVRQNATPAVGSERVFACVIAGTSLASEPTWVTTQGAKTAEAAGPTWIEVTGKPGVNGDLTNTYTWAQARVVTTSPSLGVVIKNNAATHIFVCTTAGTVGASQPTFNTTAGATTTDSGAVWTCLGTVSAYAKYAAPWARLSLALAASSFSAAGEVVYVRDTHAATQAAAITYNAGNGTAAAPAVIICVDGGVVPPTTPAYTASESTTGANSILVHGFLSVDGVTFNAGSGANAAQCSLGTSSGSSSWARMTRCGFNVTGTLATGSTVNLGGVNGGTSTSVVELFDCTVAFGNASQGLNIGGLLTMVGGSVAATGTAPTVAITNPQRGGPFVFENVDFSAVTGTILGSASTGAIMYMTNCKTASGVTFAASMASALSTQLVVNNCSNAAVNNVYRKQSFWGSAVTETSITRVGGATDGTTPFSYAVTANSNARYVAPFSTEPLGVYNVTAGSPVTLTVELTTNTALTNDLAWLSVHYLANSGFPLGARITTRPGPLDANAALTTSSATWNGTAQTFKYKIALTFTPQMTGLVTAYFRLATAATVYLDPLPVLS